MNNAYYGNGNPFELWMYPLEGNFRTRKFTDLFPDLATFQASFKECQIPLTEFAKTETDPMVTTLYYLLYARYGNSHIASSDENQFTYKMWSIVFQYGPSWSKRLDIQAKVRALTDAELERGTQAIYNSANNPEVAPSTSALEELPYISNQNTTNYKKSKIDALNEQWAMLSTDVSEEFLGRFKKLFLTIVQPEAPMYFISKEESN